MLGVNADTFSWYVAAVYPLQELVAKRELEKQGLQAFLPRYTTTRISKGREVMTVEPLFPGYIFPRFNIREERWRFINSTRGVRKLLPLCNESPTPLRNKVIDTILDQCEGEMIKETIANSIVEKFIPVGSYVRIGEGPLSGRTGKVQLSQKDRVQIILQLFGRSVTVGMKPNDVEVVGRVY